MANHGFVNFESGVPDPDKITETLENLFQNKFPGLFSINFHGEDQFWYIEFNDDEIWQLDQKIWLNDHNQIEIRHGNTLRTGDWIDYLIRATLAKRFGGYITDEGLGADEHIEINDEYLDSFKIYNKNTFFVNDEMFNNLIKRELNFLPEKLTDKLDYT